MSYTGDLLGNNLPDRGSFLGGYFSVGNCAGDNSPGVNLPGGN